jgi:hypothetical protein
MFERSMRKVPHAACLHPANRGKRAAVLAMWLVVSMSMVVAGCPSPIQYQPAEKLVDELGVPQAKSRLEEVLSRSINPRIIDLDVTEALVRYRYPLEYLFGYPSGNTTAERQIVFQEVGRIEIFKNHTVFVRGSDGTMLAQFVFPTAHDAKAFANLVASFRAYYLRVRSGLR